MRKKLTFTILFIVVLAFFVIPAKGQSIKRQTIGSYGASGNIQGVMISQTVGQPFSTLSYSDKDGSVVPGFQQPVAYTQKEVESTGIFVDLEVYPNPATHQINIKPPRDISNASLKVRDIHGRIILSEQVQDLGGYKINCKNWQKGLYTISISNGKQQNHYTSKILIAK